MTLAEVLSDEALRTEETPERYHMQTRRATAEKEGRSTVNKSTGQTELDRRRVKATRQKQDAN